MAIHAVLLAVTWFLLSFLWGALLCQESKLIQNAASLSGTIICFFLVISSHKLFSQIKAPHRLLFLAATIFHLGFIFSIALFDSSGTMLWVTDTYNMHLPGAQRLIESFQFGDAIDRTSIYDRTYMAHILVALSFAIFGVNQFASAVALLAAKLVATFFVFKIIKEFVDDKSAILGVAIYTLLPTATFYALTFYKEATVQMFVAILLYIFARLYKRFSWSRLLLFLFVLALAGNERHYLVPCFVIGLSTLFFLDRSKPDWFRLLPFPLAFVCYVAYMYVYDDMAMVTVLDSLVYYRQAYHSYEDVNQLNLQLPYAFAILKLYLTPIFTVSKLELFKGFATLLTWGSILYQMVALLALLGVWKAFKQSKLRLIALFWTPFLVFLFIFAYVAPYNGRLRDSFLPLIVVFAVLGLNTLGKLKGKSGGAF